ncbi:HD domain-containing phosphohydrolase [uncultured Treponema sp.]|uniref:HD domain-containing phosphohydrolase n=1 Tax=uncultured Treponema sp. TaxID=162155 RepID=UPI0025D1DF6A|nr:HD domain-containing phosphohydrolase [uncultured Treponema sp.]
MLSKKDLKTALFVIFCILLNLSGKYFAKTFQLPLWLDSFGTVFAAYAIGPFCGAVVGVTMNITYSHFSALSYIYSISSIVLGVTVGIVARRNWFKNFFGTMCASILVTALSVVFAVCVNWIFNDGMTNNIWGDGVIKYLEEQGMPVFISSIIGQFYMDFLDKVITLGTLYLLLKVWRKRQLVLSEIKEIKNNSSSRFMIFALLAAFLPLSKSEAESQFRNQDFTSYVQTIYSSDNGLPCGEANDIAQTPDGILWVGTYAGLYRYNGSEFRWMKDFNSVRNANCLYVDEEGRLWIGTNDNGLSICINDKIITTLDYDDGLPSNSVRAIVKGADGYYYVGTSIGILVLELNSGLRVCNIIKDVGYTVDLSADKNGFVSAITSSGELFILNETEVRFSQSLSANKEIFKCCTFDENGILYVGTTKNHIYRYKITEESATLLGKDSCDSLNYINKIYFSENRVFVCADNGIGFFTDGNPFHIIKTGSFNSSIDNMTIDYQGNYWFTSSRQGLLRISSSSFTNIYGTLGLSSKVVNSVIKWNDALYVGTDKGLDIIKDEKKISTPLSQMLDNARIRCLIKDSADNLWICTYGLGLIKTEKSGKFTVFDTTNGNVGNRMRVAVELSDGTIVAGGVRGLSFIRNNKVTKTINYNKGANSAMTLSLMQMKNGTLLAGTDGDGLAIIQNDEIVRILTLDDGLTSDVILRTVQEPEGNGVFIVTSNSLCYMSEDFEIRPLKNFPYFNNYDIQANSDGNFFVLGSAGIYVVDSEALLSDTEKLQYDLLDSKSGLNSSLTANAWNYSDEDGKLYLSCGTGVYVLDMNNYIFAKLSYHMMVSSINLDGVSFQIERSEPFIINRKTSKIELFPEVVNYTVLDPLVSYWLEGFDKSEIIIPQTQLTKVTYTNLPSGNYTFHIAVFDKDENIIEQSSYRLIKEKAIYDTTYFKVYLLLVSVLAIAWLTWVLVRNQLQHRLDIQKRQVELAKEQVRLGNETILAIAKAVDAKDENTSQHSMRVSEYSVMLARELGFSEAECENLRKAALLHDIGKIGIPDRILNKPGKLDDKEYAIMKSHVTRGAQILKDFTMIEHVHEGTLYHHEKYDGTGYPQGLKGEAIPLYGRIIGVADAFDAMTANRVYRKQLDFDYVLSELKRCRGTQFDPKIADIMLHLIETKKINVEELYKKAKKSAESEGQAGEQA